MEIKSYSQQRYRSILVALVVAAIAILVGYMSATKTLYALLLALVGLACLALAYIFFKNGRLSLDRVIIPLIIVAVLSPSIQLPGAIPAVRLELFIILVAWALLLMGHLSTGMPLKLRWNPTNKWFFVFGICILASITYAALAMNYYPAMRDFWEFGKLIEYFLIFSLVASLNIPQERMQRYYIISLAVFLCSAAFGFAQYFNLFDINSWLSPYYAPTQMYGLIKAGRIVGTSNNPNQFGALMVLAASLSLAGALWLKRRYVRVFSWMAFAVFCLAIMFTLSRSALVGLLVAAAFILFFKSLARAGLGRTIRMLIVIIPLLLILGFILYQVAPDYFSFRVGSALNLSTDVSWQIRLLRWQDALDIWKQSPVLGWGPGKETMTTIVDNEWFLLLRRYGVLGVVVFVLWFAGVYRILSRIGRETRDSYTGTFCTALQATLLAYIIYMVPAAIYHDLQLMPILLIFLGLAYTQRQPSRIIKQK